MHNYFTVYAIDNKGNAHFVMKKILPDVMHWDTVLPKLKAFWRICTIPEVVGRWYKRRCTAEVKGPDNVSKCFCTTVPDVETISYIMSVSHQFVQSLKGGTAVTARDYCNSRDIQGSNLLAMRKTKQQY